MIIHNKENPTNPIPIIMVRLFTTLSTFSTSLLNSSPPSPKDSQKLFCTLLITNSTSVINVKKWI